MSQLVGSFFFVKSFASALIFVNYSFQVVFCVTFVSFWTQKLQNESI